MINEKLIPFFGKMRVVDITSREVMNWQNTLLKAKDKNGKKYSETYIRTVENQLSAILNHAVKHYGLPSNPLQKAGRVGETGQRDEVLDDGGVPEVLRAGRRPT